MLNYYGLQPHNQGNTTTANQPHLRRHVTGDGIAFKTGELLLAAWNWFADSWQSYKKACEDWREQAFEERLECRPGEKPIWKTFGKSTKLCSEEGKQAWVDSTPKDEAERDRIKAFALSDGEHCVAGKGNVYNAPSLREGHVCRENGEIESMSITALITELVGKINLSEEEPNPTFSPIDESMINDDERERSFKETKECTPGEDSIVQQIAQEPLGQGSYLQYYAACTKKGDLKAIITTSNANEAVRQHKLLENNQCPSSHNATVYQGIYTPKDGITNLYTANLYTACPSISEQLSFKDVRKEAIKVNRQSQKKK